MVVPEHIKDLQTAKRGKNSNRIGLVFKISLLPEKVLGTFNWLDLFFL